MTEKDLAQDMKQKEQNKKLLEQIKKIEENIKLEKGNDVNIKYYDKCEITIGDNKIEVDVAEIEKTSNKTEKGNNELNNSNMENHETAKEYYLYMKGIKIAKINEQGELQVDEKALEKIDPENMLKLKGLNKEKPDMSKLEELEGKSLEDLEKDEEIGDEEDEEIGDEEFRDNELGDIDLDDMEEEIKEQEIPEEEKMEKLLAVEAKRQGVSKEELQSNMIELDLDSIKVTENKTLRDILKVSNSRVFIVPGKGENDYTIKGLNEKEGLEELTNLRKIEGNNPTQTVASLGKDGQDTKSKTTIAMFEIEGSSTHEGISISYGQQDYKEISYWRKIDKDMYMSTTVAQKNGVDRDDTSEEVKELMDKNITSEMELSKKVNFYETLSDVKEKQEVPDEVDITEDGIQVEELSEEQAKEKMIESIQKEYDYTREEATIIVNGIIDEGRDFEEAREEVENQREEERTPYGDAEAIKKVREDEGRTPWGDAEERRMRGF